MNFDKILQTDKKFSGKNTKELLVFHHTGSSNYEAMCNLLSGAKGGRNVSVHYVVALDGRVAKIGEHNDQLWHVGEGIYEGKKQNLNTRAIGIEICSNGTDYTDTQREAVKELVEYLIEEEDFEMDKLIRHADVSGYRGKWDVGPNFYMSHFGSWQEYTNSFYEEIPEWAQEAWNEYLEAGIVSGDPFGKTIDVDLETIFYRLDEISEIQHSLPRYRLVYILNSILGLKPKK